jgi:hypothetical protein
VRDFKRQLASGETKTDPELVYNAMLPNHRELADSILSEPGSTIEEKMHRRGRAMRAVTRHYGIKERGINPTQTGRRSRNDASPVKSQLDNEQQALEAARVAVYKKKRPKIYFLYLGNETSPLAQRIYPFRSPGDLSKHFRRKHLNHFKERERLSCKLCKIPLTDKTHLQRHAINVHGTVS